MSIQSRMTALLDEVHSIDTHMKGKGSKASAKDHELADTAKSGDELEMRKVMSQLAVAMHGLGMDPQDEAAQDKFVALMKKLAANPSGMKRMLMKHSGASASMKALKAAKAAL